VRRAPRLVAVLLVAACRCAAADDEYPQSIVEVAVNGVSDGPTLVVRRDATGALLIHEADLARLRLQALPGAAVVIDGERYYRIDADARTEVAVDTATQTLRLTLPASTFVETHTDVSAVEQVPHVTPARPGGFLNYDVFGERAADQSSAGAIVEAGTFGSFGVLTNSGLAQRADSHGTAVRLDSTYTLDLPDRLATLRVGDSISTTGAWGQAVRFGGVHFGTNFATQPTLVTTPLLSAKGEALLPSTVDVLMNGQRVAQEQVPPGPFNIDRVPTMNGAGQMQVIVTDVLGRQQIISQPYYTGPALLRAGLQEYAFDAGAARDDYATRSNAYGQAMMAGTYRRGITDSLTAEVHAEGESGGGRAVGIDAALQAGDIGVATLTTAMGGDGATGWLGGLGFEHAGASLSLFAQTRYTSRDFAQLGSDVRSVLPKLRTFGGLGFGFGKLGNLQLSYGRQTYWEQSSSAVFGVSHSVGLGNFGYVNFVANRSTGDGSATDVFLTWTLPLGDRRTASLGAQHTSDDSLVAVASMQQSLPVGSGAGYYVALGSNADGQIDYSYQGNAGLIGVEYARRDDRDGWRANATGGVAFTDAGMMPARMLDESFAVVQLADFAGLTVYLDNQPVGRTDAKGRVLLDSMRPYETNIISVDPREIPLDASLTTPTMTVTPAYRSGPVVRFPVVRASAVTLRLVQADGTVVPPGADVTTASESVPVARDGLVYLSVAAGAQHATATWPGHRCDFSFVRPNDAGPQPHLGDVTCGDRLLAGVPQ
jgi:outer membrane usher protein